MISVDLENVLLYHSKIINATGGSDGVRDIGLVKSALGRAEQVLMVIIYKRQILIYS